MCRDFLAPIEFAWPMGILSVLIGSVSFIGSSVQPEFGWGYLQTESAPSFQAVWAYYLLLATAFPVTLFLARYVAPIVQVVLGNVGLALLGAAGVALLASADFSDAPLWVCLIALLQAGIVAHARGRVTFGQLMGDWAVAWIGWRVAIRAVWWMPWDTFAFPSVGQACVFALITILTLAGILHPKRVRFSAGTERKIRVAFWIAASFVLAIFSYKIPGRDLMLSHHWGVITGPVDMLKQGHALYADFPSQYGMLNTLLLSKIPAATSWHALYALNGTLLLLSALGLFAFAWSLRDDLLMAPVALAAVVGAVFIFSGDAPIAEGPYKYPSVGAFRFIWVYVLCFLLFLRSVGRPWKSKSEHWIIAGALAWTCGTLWSAESAVYCSSAWFFVHIFYFSGLKGSWDKRRWLLFLLPLISLAGGSLLLEGLYWISYGQLIGPSNFFEYSSSFAAGFGRSPMSLKGPFLILLYPFLALCCVLVDHWRAWPLKTPGVSTLGIAAALWAVWSYFVGRSHPNNATNLMPVILFGCVAAAKLSSDRLHLSIRSAVAPILCVLCFVTFNGHTAWIRFNEAFVSLGNSAWSFIPVSRDGLRTLLSDAGIKSTDKLAVISIEGMPFFEKELIATWLPIHPYLLLVPLSPEKRLYYFRGFLDRENSVSEDQSYYLAAHSSIDAKSSAWVFEYLASSGFQATDQKSDHEWKVTKYHRVKAQ